MTVQSHGVRRARGAATALLVLVTLLGCTDTDGAAPRATPSVDDGRLELSAGEGRWRITFSQP